MFHIGRSGSTVLGDLLDQHPDIYWDGEIFPNLYKTIFDDWQSWRSADQESKKIDPTSPLKSRMAWAGKKWYGFETKFFHLGLVSELTLEDYLTDLDRLDFGYYIILKRKNFLRKIVSGVVAGHTSSYHINQDQAPRLRQISLDIHRVYLDQNVKPLLDLLHEYEDDFNHLDELVDCRKILRLTYEDDIINDPLSAYSKTIDYLGLDHHQVEVRYTRTNPFPLREILINFDEVEKELAGTQFAWMTAED